ncbi:flippase [Leptolyngbya sp. SLC-A1]|uniref:flippase n=1 Tax=unclassified Leptolyngbya TaxID=2650499 RepID=UPI00329782D8
MNLLAWSQPKMLRTFLKDSVIYAIPAFVSRGLSLFLIPLYIRMLSPADYGSLDLLMVFANLVNLTIALEVSQGVARFYSDASDKAYKVAYASSAFWFTVFCYSLFMVLALSYSNTLSVWVMGRSGLKVTFQIGTVYIVLNGIFYLIQNQFRWELRSKHYGIVSLSVAFSTAVAALVFIYRLRWGLEGLLLGQVFGALVGVIYGLWHLRKSFRFHFNVARLREMLAFSFPLVPSGIAVFISTYIDRLMINYFLSVEDVGIYGLGFRLASIIGLVIVGFQGALTPLIYSHHRKIDTPHQLAQIFRIFLAFALFFYLALALFSRNILLIFSPPEYYGAAEIVPFLGLAILLMNMYIFAPGISITKKTHIILWINIMGAILNSFLNWFLIPLLGIFGAALATCIGSACVFIFYMLFSQKLYFVPHKFLKLVFAAALSVILALVGTQISTFLGFDIVIKLMLLTIFVTTVFKIGLISMSEITSATKFLR